MDRINQIWPRWQTVELIGRGAYGEVYKVKRELLGETFYSAVKVIRIPQEDGEIRELLSDGHTSQSIQNYYGSIARGLINEIKLLDTLKSAENVVTIEEFEVQERTDGIGWEAYIRMELLQNLDRYRAKHSLGQEEVVKLGLDICQALICCQKNKIVHRDIKPSNIFVDVYGHFKLGDFGVARQMEKTQGTLSQKGTASYMAPELRLGDCQGSYNVDIYSLGLVMYRLLNRNKLPLEPQDKDICSAQEREEAQIRRLRGEILPIPVQADQELGRIICKACEADRDKRYRSAQEMWQELQNWKNSRIPEKSEVQITGQKENSESELSINKVRMKDETEEFTRHIFREASRDQLNNPPKEAEKPEEEIPSQKGREIPVISSVAENLQQNQKKDKQRKRTPFLLAGGGFLFLGIFLVVLFKNGTGKSNISSEDLSQKLQSATEFQEEETLKDQLSQEEKEILSQVQTAIDTFEQSPIREVEETETAIYGNEKVEDDVLSVNKMIVDTERQVALERNTYSSFEDWSIYSREDGKDYYYQDTYGDPEGTGEYREYTERMLVNEDAPNLYRYEYLIERLMPKEPETIINQEIPGVIDVEVSSQDTEAGELEVSLSITYRESIAEVEQQLENTTLPDALVTKAQAGEWESLNNFKQKFEEAYQETVQEWRYCFTKEEHRLVRSSQRMEMIYNEKAQEVWEAYEGISYDIVYEGLLEMGKSQEEASAQAQEFKDSQNTGMTVGDLRERTYLTGEECEIIQVPTEYYDTVYTES